MPDFDRGEALMTLFEARRYDLASKADRKTMAGIINDALEVTTIAERWRCAEIAHAVSVDMQVQIDRNDEYMARTASNDQGPNELCRRTQRCADQIEESIRG